MKVLITGGTGYIGSHCAVDLLKNDYEIVIADNLCNSHRSVIERIETITNKTVGFFEIDICDRSALEDLFARHNIDAVIHCAGLKAVGESVEKPLEYYRNNIDATLSLLEVMENHKVRKLVFSSSATVYGTSPVPYKETDQTGQGISNPYGQTKYMIERILADTAHTNSDNAFVALRYFNPVGADPSGLIGEDPLGTPNNLMPLIAQVASGKREKLTVWGNDYDTPDGTCVRDFIHVVDLARGHSAALDRLKPGFDAINLGSGSGLSVLQMVKAFEKASDKKIPYEIGPRRSGDLPSFYADTTKAAEILNWRSEKSIADTCADTWRWQANNLTS